MSTQTGILPAPPRGARLLTYRFGGDAGTALARLSRLNPLPGQVIGLGHPFLAAAEAGVPGLRAFPALSGPGVAYPSTQEALWTFLPGEDAGKTLHDARRFSQEIGPGFTIAEETLCFQYAEGRDLSGYEDGTENPKGENAAKAALVSGAGPGLDGSSFVAVQKWVHDLGRFEARSQPERDRIIGRHHATNEELGDAPPSAHVKRAAQETYEPAAFMLRRSMPWGEVTANGLYFVAYGSSLDAFERVLTRMAGIEDGIPDALSSFTRPISGGYYWCPPLRDGKLDLTALGPRAS